MGAFAVTADFRHIFIRVGDADPAVSCGNNPGNIFLRQFRLLQHILQHPGSAFSRFGSGTYHGKGHDFPVLVHNYRVGGCGTAVNSHYIHLSVFLLLSDRLLFPRLQGFQKRLDSGQYLSVALSGIIRLQQKQRPLKPSLQPGILISIVVAELHRMVNDSVRAVRIPADQFIPVGRLLHPHTRELAQQSPDVAGHHRVLLHQDFPCHTGTGQIKGHIDVFRPENFLNALIGPGTQDPNVQSSLPDRHLSVLCLLFLQKFRETRFLKMFSGKFLILPDHIPDPLLIENNSRVFGNPGCIQHINKPVRIFLLQHIVQPTDAVAAGGKDHSLIIPLYHVLQHSFGKTADIGVHPHIRLPEAGHVRFDSLHLHPHSLEHFNGGIFADIS